MFIIFICVFCYVPCKEGAEFPCPQLISRLISCSRIVYGILKSRNSQRVCRALLICTALRTGSGQQSLFACGKNTSD